MSPVRTRQTGIPEADAWKASIPQLRITFVAHATAELLVPDHSTERLPAQLQAEDGQPYAERQPERTRRNHRGQRRAGKRARHSAHNQLDHDQLVILTGDQMQAAADRRESEAE